MVKCFGIKCFVILVCLLEANSENSLHPPTVVDKLVSDYFEIVKNLWKLIENRTENVLVEAEKRLSNIELSGEDDIHLQFSIEDIDKKEYGDQVSKILSDIRSKYDSKVKDSSELNEKTIKARNLTTMLYDITSLDEFWDAALEKAKTSASTISLYNTAAQQILLRYYYVIQLAYLRCFAMFQRLHMTAYLKYSGENVIHKSQAQELIEEFQKIFSNTRNVAKSRFGLASKETLSWTSYSYTKVTNFLQGFIDNEANLNPENSCLSQCSDYKQTKHFNCQSGSLCDMEEGYQPNLQCNGIIRDCYEVDSSDVVLCLDKHDSTRRYNGIRIKNKLVAGRDIGSCQIKAVSWLRGFFRCTNCYCLCDDTTASERHFSLRNVVSNIDENKVITAVKLNKVSGVIQFQIKERTLLPYAQLDNRDMVFTIDGWLSAPFFAVTDLNITNNVDFHELSYDKRSINLDEVKLPNGQVLTGVRFCVKNDHLTIEVRGTPFDYATGKLKGQEESAWYSNAKGFNKISLDNLNSADASTFSSYFKDEISRIKDAYVQFGPTGYSADIGQTTIPFIDTTSVEPRYVVPLTGLGLYYKSSVYWAGYIAPKLIVYDFEPHMLA